MLKCYPSGWAIEKNSHEGKQNNNNVTSHIAKIRAIFRVMSDNELSITLQHSVYKLNK